MGWLYIIIFIFRVYWDLTLIPKSVLSHPTGLFTIACGVLGQKIGVRSKVSGKNQLFAVKTHEPFGALLCLSTC